MSFTVPIAESDVTSLVADLALKAPLASPSLTGTPLAPTAVQGTNTTQLATTAMMQSEVSLLAAKASPTFTGTVTIPNGASATDAAAYGQVPVLGTVAGFQKMVFRTGDATPITSSATFANDDTLLWTVGANDVWYFQGFLTFTMANSGGAAATGDAKISFSVPASGTMQWGFLGGAGNTLVGYNTTLPASSPQSVVPAAGSQTTGGAAVTFGVTTTGYYTGGGTSGTVHLQWAQRVSDASTLQINTNSLLLLWRIA